jgi:hypothetical protein
VRSKLNIVSNRDFRHCAVLASVPSIVGQIVKLSWESIETAACFRG